MYFVFVTHYVLNICTCAGQYEDDTAWLADHVLPILGLINHYCGAKVPAACSLLYGAQQP